MWEDVVVPEFYKDKDTHSGILFSIYIDQFLIEITAWCYKAVRNKFL